MKKQNYFKGKVRVEGQIVPWESSFPVDTRYDCVRCGLCCFSRIDLMPRDVDHMRRKGLLEDTCNFTTPPSGEYIPTTTELTRMRNVSSGACIWLDDKRLCSKYEHRPFICRTFPFGPAVGVDRNLVMDINLRCPYVMDSDMPKIKKSDLQASMEEYIKNDQNILVKLDASRVLVKSVGYAYDPAWLPNGLRLSFMEPALRLLTSLKGVNNLPLFAQAWADAVAQESHKVIVERDNGIIDSPKQSKDILTAVRTRLSSFNDRPLRIAKQEWKAILADSNGAIFHMRRRKPFGRFVKLGRSIKAGKEIFAYKDLESLVYDAPALQRLLDYLIINMRRPRYQVSMAMAAEYAVKFKGRPIVDYELEAEFISRALIAHIDAIARIQAAVHKKSRIGVQEVALAIANMDAQITSGYVDGTILAELKREINQAD